MAQEFTNAAKVVMLDALVSTYTTVYVSAHTADPTLTGGAEVTGGSYARQALSYNAASGNSKTTSATATIPIPAGNTVTYLGLWSLASGGVFLGQVAITSEAFGSDGNLDVTAFTLALDQDPA